MDSLIVWCIVEADGKGASSVPSETPFQRHLLRTSCFSTIICSWLRLPLSCPISSLVPSFRCLLGSKVNNNAPMTGSYPAALHVSGIKDETGELAPDATRSFFLGSNIESAWNGFESIYFSR
jgi:hypothetical protein